MTLYATLDDAKTQAKATATGEDDVLQRNLRVVSRRIDRLFASRRPHFAPYIEQREFYLDPAMVNTSEYTFRFSDPLLALTAVTVASEALTLATQVEAWPTLATPYHKLRLVCYGSWYSFCNSTNEWPLVKITGTWGYHRDWANAWQTITTLNGAIVSTTATSITLTNVDAADAWGLTPGISAGSLIRIDSEYLEVTATNTTTNVATVRRGVNGSTAATHLTSTAVEAYQVEDAIRDVVARQAAFKNKRRGSYENATIGELTVSYPSDMLHELRAVVGEFAAL